MLVGTNFTGVTGVTFDGVPATSVSAPNATQIILTAPAHPVAGPVSVLVTTPGGTNADNIAYTYVAPPTVTSSAATSVTSTTATLNGNVTSDGGSAIFERGFVYKTTSGVTITDNKTIVSGTTGSYTLNLSSLTPGTQYFFKAYAMNTGGTTLSSPELSFTTDTTLASDYFRSCNPLDCGGDGDWATPASWQSSHDGLTGWITATQAPTTAANTVTIIAGYNINVSTNVTADQVVIPSGGYLSVVDHTFTIGGGADTNDIDLTEDAGGTLFVQGSAAIVNNGQTSLAGEVQRAGQTGGLGLISGNGFTYTGTASLLNYNSNGFGNASTNDTEFPAVNGPANLRVFIGEPITQPGALTLHDSRSIPGEISLEYGRVVTGPNTLVLGAGGTMPRSSGVCPGFFCFLFEGYVDGNFQKTFTAAGTKTFEVGTADGYSPVDVTAASAGDFAVRAVQGAQPNIPGANKIARYWTLTNGGVTSADLVFHYLQGDVAPATESALLLYRYDAPIFTQVPATYDNSANTATATGITSFSDWTLAEPGAINTPPSITPISVSPQLGSPSANVKIASVTDDGGNGNVTVTVNPATSFGVTISNITNDGSGNIFADVVANCSATTGTFILTATDGASAFTDAPYQVNTTPNAPPTLTYPTPPGQIYGATFNVSPTTATDNGTITTYQILTGHGFTTAPTVNSSGVVSISTALPAGSHTVTVRATDNCGATTDSSFTVMIGAAPVISIDDITQVETDAGTTTFTFTLTKTGATDLDATGDFTTNNGLVNPATSGSCGQAGVDYVGLGGNFGFLPSETTKPFVVTVCGDTFFEQNETFTVDLSNPGNATYSDAQGLGTITNDDLPDTDITISSGALTITDVNGANTDDDLRLSCNGTNLRIFDPTHVVGAGSGSTQIDPNTVEIPLSSLTSITINSLGGNDTLTVNLTGCDIIPGSALSGDGASLIATGITFNGGDPTSGPGDKLNIVGGSQGQVTYNYTNAHDGSVVMTGGTVTGTINYTGLEPISNTGTAADVIFNLPAGPTTPATLSDDGTTSNGMSRLSGATFETTDFANPTGSVTINRGNAADTLTVNALPDLDSSLTFGAAGAEFASITFNGAVTLASNKNLEGYATGTISLPNAASDIATSDSGSILLTTATNISMLSGSSLSTVNGDVTLNANQQATATTGAFVGMLIDAATVRATGTGVVTIAARGGNSGNALGISMDNAAIVQGGSGSNMTTLSMTGTGGTGGTNTHGIQIGRGSTVTTLSGGSVSLVGSGGNSSPDQSIGFILFPTGSVTAGTNGNITATGTGGIGGGNANDGIRIDGGGSGLFATGTGTITVNATGGIGNSPGVNISRGGAISATGGLVSVTGTRGTTNSGIWMNPLATAGSTISSIPNGTVTLISDSMDLTAATSISASGASGIVNLRQKTNGQTIDLGGNDAPDTLGLTDAELDKVTAATMNIGDANSGVVNVSGVITQTKTTNILSPQPTTVLTGGDLGIFGSVTGMLVVNNGAALRPGASPGIIASGGNSTLNSGSQFYVELGGTTPGNGAGFHDQWNITGNRDINSTLNVALVGGFTPAPTDTFTIITNTGSQVGSFLGGVIWPVGYTGTVNYNANSIVLSNITLLTPDLTMTKTNDVSGSAVVGQTWTWSLNIANGGTGDAVFASGQTLVTDNLPNGAEVTYGTPTTAANATCSIDGSKNLSCVAGAGGLTIAPAGTVTVLFTATANAPATEANPRSGGIAQVDPGSVITESNEANNDASNSVTVDKANTTTSITNAVALGTATNIGQAYAVDWTVAIVNPGAGTLTGTVTVSDGTDSCTAAVTAGTCMLTSTTQGTKNIVATYNGDTNFNGSTSAGVSHLVNCTSNPVVTNMDDDGPGSLRRAVLNACPGSTITFAPSVMGPILLSSGQITINTDNLIIEGPAVVQNTQGPSNTSRVFVISPGLTTTINRLTISGGNLSGANDGGGIVTGGMLTINDSTVSGNTAGGRGGAIFSAGPALNLNNVMISGNTAASGGGVQALNSTLIIDSTSVTGNTVTGNGGGVLISGGSGHIFRKSTFSGNTASSCGGFQNDSLSSLTVTNTTVSGNNATGGGGGGLCTFNSTATLTNVTVFNNTTNGSGGGINFADAGTTLTLKNTIVAGNMGNQPDISANGGATIVTGGYNLIGNNDNVSGVFPTGNPNANNDIVGMPGSPVNPLVGPLANNGGPTQTHALLLGSPAIDKGSAVVPALTTDQRGSPRPLDVAGYPNAMGGNGSDIGAFEAQITTAGSVSIAGRVTSSDGRGIRNARIVVSGGSLTQPRVTATGPRGTYTVGDLQTGQTYVITINSRRFTFSIPSRVISLVDNVTDADFVADPIQ
ncbi:MAG: choice-of-anchor Q domain-containing protein [Pyrinomonadaceae bacterium]